MAVTQYCTETQLNEFFSAQGITDYADHDDDNVADTNVVNNAIDEASEHINLYARERYAVADLQSSTMVTRWCVKLACYFLCMHRGNPPPDILAVEFERITTVLDQVRMSKMEIPGVQLKDSLVPTFSNLTVDRRYRRSTVRVTRQNSSKESSKRTQDSSGDPYGL